MNTVIEFSEFVAFPLQCFRVYGLNPQGASDGGKWKRLRQVYHFFALANMSVSIALMVIYVCKHIDNLALVAQNAPPYGYTALAVLKSIAIYLHNIEFSDLLKTLNDLFPKTKDEQKAFKVRSYFNGYKRMERVFAFMLSVVCIGFIVVPIVKLILTRGRDNKLPIETWYPFDEYDPRFYSLVLIWLSLSSIIGNAALIGTDLILIAFIILICMQFNILSERIRKLKDFPTADVRNKFVEVIEMHKTLIRLSEQVEKIYSVPIFFNFFGSSILICFVGYQMSVGVDFESILKSSNFLSSALLQILMLCYYGSKLTTASEIVSEAVYDSGWHTRINKKLDIELLIMLQRSQTPTAITAYKFSTVSLNVFTTVSFLKN